MSSSMGVDVGRIARQISTAVERGRTKTVQQSADRAKKIHLGLLRAATGGDLKMSGVGKNGSKIGVRYNIRGGSNVSAFIKATGALHLLERPTVGRVIRSKHAKGRQRRGFIGPTAGGQFRGGRQAVLNIPGIGFRRSARHPGTKGQEPWAKSRKAAEPVIRKTMQTETRRVIFAAAKK